jgi:hypothetical protein
LESDPSGFARMSTCGSFYTRIKLRVYAQASANIHSLLITANANGIEPVSYMTCVIERLPHCKTIEDCEALLPASSS